MSHFTLIHTIFGVNELVRKSEVYLEPSRKCLMEFFFYKNSRFYPLIIFDKKLHRRF